MGPMFDAQVKQKGNDMGKALHKIEFPTCELELAGANKPVAFGKYQALAMTPQTTHATVKMRKDGTLAGRVAIGLDPFHESLLNERRARLAQRIRMAGFATLRRHLNPAPTQPQRQPQPQPTRHALSPLFALGARRVRQRLSVVGPALANRPLAPKNSTMASLPARLSPTAPGSRAQLRLASATPSPSQDAAELRKLESIPTKGSHIMAQDLRFTPEHMRLRLKRQRMLGLACG